MRRLKKAAQAQADAGQNQPEPPAIRRIWRIDWISAWPRLRQTHILVTIGSGTQPMTRNAGSRWSAPGSHFNHGGHLNYKFRPLPGKCSPADETTAAGRFQPGRQSPASAAAARSAC